MSLTRSQEFEQLNSSLQSIHNIQARYMESKVRYAG